MKNNVGLLDDKIATCQKCLKDFTEEQVNMIDYEVDLCVDCENEFLKEQPTEENLKRREHLMFSRLEEYMNDFDLTFISLDTSEFILYYSAKNKEDNTDCLLKLDRNDCISIKTTEDSSFEYYGTLKRD